MTTNFDDQDTLQWIPVVHVSGELCTFPIASALLALWERPWSSTALRYAYHALHRAYARWIDVLES